MMAVNRGKQFETVIRQAFDRLEDVSVDRLHDQMNGFKGSQNICDFIVFRQPYQFYFECKSVHGNTLSIYSKPTRSVNGKLQGYHGNITDTQWRGLLEKSDIPGVHAGIICWWIDHGITRFIPIQYLDWLYRLGKKSIRFDNEAGIRIYGKKKRVFWDYDMKGFLDEFIR